MNESTLFSPIVSVIMPMYNAADSIGNAINSVLDTYRKNDIEIIVVDDCSTDDSMAVAEEIQKDNPNIHIYSMPQNSGSPSAPRNLGIEKATGEYITFLDDDDWVNADNLIKMVEYADYNHVDFLKGYLYVVNNNEKSIQNRLPYTSELNSNIIKHLISLQSTTQDFIVRRTLLMEKNLRYIKDLKIGEDTVFIASILSCANDVRYIDKYFLFYNKTAINLSSVSSTQHFGDREMNDQITAWELAEEILSNISLSYYHLRLHASFRNLLLSIVRFSEGISSETFIRLHTFASINKAHLNGKMNLHKRYEALFHSILEGDYHAYLDAAKKRLLIAGYDLKFVLPIIPYLSNDFSIRIDEWEGHAAHDKKQSEDCAIWADIIWCEWMLGNAVFYNKIVNSNQRMVIRAHRFELERNFGYQIDYSKVSMVFAVGYYYFEQFSSKFSIPREKMRLLHNYVEDSIYKYNKARQERFNIGMIGILPARKGFYKGLQLLVKLREHDNRFKLTIMGDRPENVSWINNNPSEKEYFDKCNTFIRDNQLSDFVVYGGYKERSVLYDDIDYVLSLSDSEFPESFHLSPAEGACSGAMGLILKWPGVEFIYPKDFVFSSIEEIEEQVLFALKDDEFFHNQVLKLHDFIVDNYSIDKFLKILGFYLKQLFSLG
ncbi:MAG: glycosyltransferase [Clostridiales bacterium]|jgi:glycosyltransferase involved in cell wall biosynthesis|nr:glycosyltransferase [Clostridiales bacterium]